MRGESGQMLRRVAHIVDLPPFKSRPTTDSDLATFSLTSSMENQT